MAAPPAEPPIAYENFVQMKQMYLDILKQTRYGMSSRYRDGLTE